MLVFVALLAIDVLDTDEGRWPIQRHVPRTWLQPPGNCSWVTTVTDSLDTIDVRESFLAKASLLTGDYLLLAAAPPRPLCAVTSHLLTTGLTACAWMQSPLPPLDAPVRNVDIKLLFDPTDMTPGPAGLRFRRDLLLASGKTDTRGYSIADTFLRQDEGAVTAAGAPVAGVPVIPPGAAGNAPRMAQRARRKEGFTLLTTHIADENTRTILGNPAHPAFGRADLAYEFVMQRIIVAVTASDVQGAE